MTEHETPHAASPVETDLKGYDAELRALIQTDIAQIRAAAQEFYDSAMACDTPALRSFRRSRNLRGNALVDASDRYASLLSERAALTARADEAEKEAAALRACLEDAVAILDNGSLGVPADSEAASWLHGTIASCVKAMQVELAARLTSTEKPDER